MPEDPKKQESLDRMVKEAAAKKYGLGTIVADSEKVSGAAEKINTLAADVERMKPIVEKVALIQDSIKGEDGKDGVDGNHGNDGTDGIDGQDGADGIDGVDGVDGKDGRNGVDGKDGTNGTNGTDADPIKVIEAIKTLKGKDAQAFSEVVGSKIDISHVRNAGSFIFNGKQYKTEELMHGGGTSGAGGTVTTVSVVTANGFSGTVATATTTPAITLTTSITGLLKGNGTAISAATTGTDYQAPITLTTTGSSGAATFISNVLNIPQYLGGSGTPGGLNTQLQYNNSGSFGGITGATTDGTSVSLNAAHLLNPTINGAGAGLATLAYPNTASSATITLPTVTSTLATLAGTETLTNKDLTSGTNTFPTFNQNTTGSAAKWTTARLLAGNSVDGSANVAFANKFIVQGTTDTGLSGAQFLGALTTGIVKNTTTTGVLSIAVAADFPTLNQNTTGSAATLTTPRTIGIATGDATSAGSTFNGSANNTNALTLATVNGNVGSFTNANITVNAKGLITAAANGTAGLTTLTVGTTTITSGTTTRMLYNNAGVLGETTGITTNGTVATLTTPILNGIPTGTGVATAATASTLALRDANGNLIAVNHINGYTTVVTAAGTTTLTVGSNQIYVFTGTTTQTVTMPVVATLVTGMQWFFFNASTGAVTVNSSGGSAIVVMAGLTAALFTVVGTVATDNTSWDTDYKSAAAASGKKASFSNSLTFAGTDATTMTFPTTSATMARTDAAQTFTGVQTFSSAPSLSTGTITAATFLQTFPGSAQTLVGRTTTDTLTNKRNQPRTASSTTNATLAPDLTSANVYYRTTQTASLAVSAPIGTPVIGETIAMYIDAAGAQTLTMDATYIPFGTAFPASLTAGKTMMIVAQYNGTNWKTTWVNAA